MASLWEQLGQSPSAQGLCSRSVTQEHPPGLGVQQPQPHPPAWCGFLLPAAPHNTKGGLGTLRTRQGRPSVTSHTPFHSPQQQWVRLKLRLSAGSGPDGRLGPLACTKLRPNVMATAWQDCWAVCTCMLVCVLTWGYVCACARVSVHLHKYVGVCARVERGVCVHMGCASTPIRMTGTAPGLQQQGSAGHQETVDTITSSYAVKGH